MGSKKTVKKTVAEKFQQTVKEDGVVKYDLILDELLSNLAIRDTHALAVCQFLYELDLIKCRKIVSRETDGTATSHVFYTANGKLRKIIDDLGWPMGLLWKNTTEADVIEHDAKTD